MTATQTLREAWAALASHRLRATLSGAGIVFGVATVVAALAIAEGARRRAYDEAAALGVDNVFIRSRPAAAGYAPVPRFTGADLAIVTRGQSSAYVSPVRRARGDVQRGSRSITATVAGVAPAWRDVAELAITSGRWFDDRDMRERRRVIVLTPPLVSALSGDAPVLGSAVRWNGRWFTVIGTAAAGRRADGEAAAYIPLTAADIRLTHDDDGRGAQEIALRVRGDSPEAAAAAAARSLSRRGHPAASFDVVVPRALMRARLETQRTFDWVLFGVGALALAISGIGIMNIMLASVAERTGEIGVRRAAGARRRDVLAQFAAESALLCLAGGAAGIPLGALFAALIATGAGWPVAIAPSSVGLALLLAAAVGMAFGTYPAHRAAMLDPVEALRS